jgi:anti-sigma regulatory factor (Ser/Thr protein kinase)
MDSHFNRYKIEDRSYIAFIKREIHLKAVGAKFDKIEVGKIDIIVSELTSNLIKHAIEGELLYRISINAGNVPTFEVICIDKGPGISDMPSAMRDGTSTKGTMGGGLGAMQRMSSLFQIFSMRQWGTVLYSRVGPEARVSEQSKSGLDLDVRAVCVPKAHEEVCGDGYKVVNTATHTKILFGDGLGHGPHAKEAMDAAGNFFFESEDNEPVEIIRRMHEEVRRTRGLVAAVAVIDKKAARWHLCGVGNISVRLYSGIEYRNYMSYNGTIGMNIPKSMNSTIIPLERNQHLIMCSDGLTTRWNLGPYPAIFKYDANLLAGVLYKDFSRGNDDASILIAKVI